MLNELLFICSGNFYRSRFAEAVFNHHAVRRGLRWRAFSRGLATHLVAGCGDLSVHTEDALKALGIERASTGPFPVQLARPDLQRAARIVALKEAEHRPMMEEQFPDWAGRIVYWHVHDLDGCGPGQALGEIERTVAALVEELDRLGPEPADERADEPSGMRS